MSLQPRRALFGFTKVAIGLLLAGASTPACSGGVTDLSCGEGTVQVDDRCIAADGAGGEGGDASSGGAGTGGADGGTDEGTGGNDDGGTGGNGDGGTGGNDDGGTGGNGDGTGGDGTGGDGGTGGADGGTGGSGTGGSDDGTGGNGSGGSGPSNDLISERLDCVSRDVTGATVVSGVITSDTTWSGVVHVVANLSVQNEATLTIEPGTTVIVGHDVEIQFGWENSAPTLHAVGTVEDPIRFCGEAAGAGYWLHLKTGPNVTPDSILQNVLISGAGSDSLVSYAALDLGGPITVRGVQVVDTPLTAVRAVAFGAQSETLNVESSHSRVAAVEGPGAMSWPPHSTVTGPNVGSSIRVNDAAFDRDMTIRNLGLPYEVWTADVVSDNDDATIVFEPGVVYRSNQLDFGHARVLAQGTEAEPVEFDCPTLGGCDASTAMQISSTEESELTYVNVPFDVTADGSAPLLMRNVQAIQNLTLSTGFASGSRDIQATFLFIPACTDVEDFPGFDVMVTYFEPTVLGAGDVCTLLTPDEEGVPRYAFKGLEIGAGATFTMLEGSFAFFEEGALTVEPGGALSILGTEEAPAWLGYAAGVRLWSSDVTIQYALVSRSVADQEEANPVCSAAVVTSEPIELDNSQITSSVPYTALCISATDVTDYTVTNTLRQGTTPVTPITFVP